uniref:Succinate dehydrogenase assembly factor 4, mitochondrial n=1 Tax=Knipowitschia caucasica TaxID=637954 RepID=A0AAV2JM74_KNICA
MWSVCVSARCHGVFPRLTVSALCKGGWRASSGAAKDREPLKKPNTPQGRFDQAEKVDQVLEKFPEDINPATKEKGGPRGLEPTRYGDWERKGRCCALYRAERNHGGLRTDTSVSQADGREGKISAVQLLTGHQYRVRRPLFTPQHTSILKKTHVADRTLQKDTHTVDDNLTAMRPLLSPQTNLSPSGKLSTIAFLPSCSTPELKLYSDPVPLPYPLSSPIRPPLCSPVLHPRYSPLSGLRRTQPLEGTSSTSYQAEYWACAIPKDPPPSPSGADPHQDYEALLDYTYPLRPQAGEWTFQDSGIEVDHLSTGLSELNLSFGAKHHPKDPLCLSPDLIDSMPHFSTTDRVLSVEDLKWSPQRDTAVPSISASLITLPWDRGFQDDEEFRPLPEKLELLQQLSQQVYEAAALLHPAHRYSSTGQDAFDATDGNLKKEDKLFLDMGDSVSGPEEHSSLMEHISVFCSHLEQLVRWLYVASQKIEHLVPPTVDIHSVKSSLAQYQTFHRDVNSHMPLTSSVLQTGRLLLSCIHSTSPVLRDTLLLIESQSRLLETHTEDFFSSILAAMDSLTQPAPTAPDREPEAQSRVA